MRSRIRVLSIPCVLDSLRSQCGVRIGRGSVIPDWLAADPMRDVSIRRLQPGRFYSYFVSPDNKVVIFDPGTRRVARIVSRRG